MVGFASSDSSLASLHFCLAALDWNFGAGASYWSDHQSLPPRRPIGQITNKCRQQRSTLYSMYIRAVIATQGLGGGGLLPEVGICFEFGEYS
jgi:hypothetical protein